MIFELKSTSSWPLFWKLFEHLRHIQSVQDFVLIVIYFVVSLLWFIEFGRIFELYKKHWINQNWLIILQDRSKMYISIYCQAFWVIKSLFKACFNNLIPTFLASNTQNQTYFHVKKPSSFFGFPCKDMFYLSYDANVNIIIIDFHQKYVEVKCLRRSG